MQWKCCQFCVVGIGEGGLEECLGEVRHLWQNGRGPVALARPHTQFRHMHTCAQHSLVKKLIFRLEQKIQENTFAFPLPRDPGRRKNILGIVLVGENKPTGHVTHLPLPPSR